MDSQYYSAVPATLRSVLLRKCECERLQSDEPKGKGAVTIKVGAELETPKHGFAPGQSFRVGIEVTVVGHSAAEGEESKEVFRTSCIVDGIFSTEDSESLSHAVLEESMPVYINRVYPLAREHLAETLRRMGFFNVKIPFELKREDRPEEGG